MGEARMAGSPAAAHGVNESFERARTARAPTTSSVAAAGCGPARVVDYRTIFIQALVSLNDVVKSIAQTHHLGTKSLCTKRQPPSAAG